MNIDKIRTDFPLLAKNLIYFDSACMALCPQSVIDTVTRYYTDISACAGRSAHKLAKTLDLEIATSRHAIRSFINARNDENLVFTRNTTESINLVANGLTLSPGDEVIISDKEHNSNLIPWLKRGVNLVICKTNDDNTFNLESLQDCMSSRTKLVSMVHRSNLDGVTNPIKDIAKIAHKHHALLHVDGAQSVPSMPIDVRSLGCDFLSFSGHKLFGPTGIGVLYGTTDALSQLNQFIVGGETVKDSTYTSFVPEDVPHKFEAGLQHYAGIMGLGAACTYLKKIGMDAIERHERKLNQYATDMLATDVDIIGPGAAQRAGIFSFIPKLPAHDVTTMLSHANIMTRSGAFCVHSWFNARNKLLAVRASFSVYNNSAEVEAFAKKLQSILAL